jgi:ribose transport system permease protein
MTSIKRLPSDYGMLVVLFALAAFFSVLTYKQQQPTGAEAASAFLAQFSNDKNMSWIAVAGNGPQEDAFSQRISSFLSNDPSQAARLKIVRATPQDARQAISSAEQDPSVEQLSIALSPDSSQWKLFENFAGKFPRLNPKIVAPKPYHWPNFLKKDNLLNIANQIVVIAVIAVGMTLVIIAGGIDLSVGSLIALSAVLTTRLIRDFGGNESATIVAMVVCSLIAIAACSFAGAISGGLVAWFDIPPFIATLAMMLVTSGFAYLLSEGQSIDQIPAQFVWLGRGAMIGIPNSIWLIVVLYCIAYFAMNRMMYGRCVYAVGGNREAARLSGINVRSITISTYVVCGALAGLGGVLMASQLKSGAPTYGAMYELYVIAAVVVGGTSLRGGEGKVVGTLIGALIIAVIQNGMNLTGIESYTQKVVFGLVILAAVMIDHWRRKRG